MYENFFVFVGVFANVAFILFVLQIALIDEFLNGTANCNSRTKEVQVVWDHYQDFGKKHK